MWYNEKMTIEEIEKEHGLPFRAKNPCMTDGKITGHVTRNVHRKHETRDDWYIQSNPKRPQDGEFIMCCGNKKSNHWEFIEKIS